MSICLSINQSIYLSLYDRLFPSILSGDGALDSDQWQRDHICATCRRLSLMICGHLWSSWINHPCHSFLLDPIPLTLTPRRPEEAVDTRVSAIWRYNLEALPNKQIKLYIDPTVPRLEIKEKKICWWHQKNGKQIGTRLEFERVRVSTTHFPHVWSLVSSHGAEAFLWEVHPGKG